MPDSGEGHLETIAARLEATDLMVFELRDGRAHLLGGVGRGAGWAGVVELDPADEPILRDVLGQRVVRVDASEPVRIIGPYWAAHAALALSGEHVMVAGSAGAIRSSSAELIRRTTEAAAHVGDIPPSKLLADELEVVEAIRQLTDHLPTTLTETATHAASVAADALAAEIGVVLLSRGDETRVFGAGSAWPAIADDDVLCEAFHELARRAAAGPIVEQDLAAVGASGVRVVSCYALGIGRTQQLGALIVGHTDERPRGFTLLCQRVGRALADASETALLRAMAHEELAAQRDRFALEARTDPLTGLGNRVMWQDMLAIEQARWERHGRPPLILVTDLDALKVTNDLYGHAVGDELLVAAADILRRSMRGGDIIARIGGDEFAALLPDTDPSAGEAVRRRVLAACGAWEGSRPGIRLSLSLGWATPRPGDRLDDAMARADAAMYAAKREIGPATAG